MKTKNKAASMRLTLVVEYDAIEDRADIEEVVEKARERGTITRADLEVLKVCVMDLK